MRNGVLKYTVLKQRLLYLVRENLTLRLLVFDIERLQLATELKYLGVVFTNSAKFNNCNVPSKQQVTKATFVLLSQGRILNLPIDVMFELFDEIVLPIILYAFEIWGL